MSKCKVVDYEWDPDEMELAWGLPFKTTTIGEFDTISDAMKAAEKAAIEGGVGRYDREEPIEKWWTFGTVDDEEFESFEVPNLILSFYTTGHCHYRELRVIPG